MKTNFTEAIHNCLVYMAVKGVFNVKKEDHGSPSRFVGQ